MSIEDTLIRRQIFIQRFAGSQARAAQDMLEGLYETLNERIMRATTDFQLQRLTILRTDISVLMSTGFDEIDDFITANALELSEAELEFSHTAMQSGSTVRLSIPALTQVEQAVLNVGMDTPVGPGTLTLNDAIDLFKANKKLDITKVINDAILIGDTTKQVTRNLSGMLGSQHKHQIEALVRTSTNHAASMARKRLVEENASVLKGEEWVATLDGRTTLICAGRDGKIYPPGKGPYPPAHWNCRSVRVPVVDPRFAMGIQSARRPQVGAKGRGTTTGKTKFDGWLRRQPANFQDEYFSQFPDGAEKAKLFRVGELKIDRFRDETGRDFTLEQLKSLEPIAFGKADITTP